ncbi:putative membrane protein [Streptomyces himastatinicus ATCC 53653]|uniref:Putative membrane protein n=2 Tax=Streptomyces violaceusniger group TaxID=2839105 RepID=D9WDF5_9ACTN|nr:putative membrane protein [Streptomyces himastatinicus ATCC 53653]
MMRKHSETEVFRITGARQGLADDVRGRQRRYVISMSVRTVAVVLAAVLWNVERHVAIVALVLGVLLPYVAVVIANAGRENAPSLPTTFVPTPMRPMLGSGRDETPSDAEPHSAPHSTPHSASAESGAEDAAHTSEDGRGGHG